MICVEMIVSGIVQGVGFRFYTERTANKLKISGYVKNQRDDTVYIIAYGKDDNMKKFIDWVKIGPRSAVVSKVDIKTIETPINLKGFKVKF